MLTSALCIPLSRSLAYRVPIDNSWSVEQLRAASAVSCLAAAQDGVVLRAALAALRTAPPADRADEPETAALQLSVLQVACVLYAQIDAVETQQANAAGWPEPESTPQATDAAAAALHAAAPQLAAAACPLVSSALGGLTGLAWFRPLYAALAEYVLRFLRHLASLEPLPGGSTAPLLEASAVTAAVTAVLQKEESSALLRHLALSALWAWLDAQPNGAGTLAACPDAVACMLSLLAPLKAPAEYAPWANEAECEEHNNNTRRQVAGELQSSAVGSLWGCCSRVSPDAVAAFADAGVADAAAALLTADADASTPSARFCAAGLLAGWLAACAPAPPARLVAAWAAPGVAAATAAMLARDAAALARGGVEADVLFDVLQFDWKTRDLSEAVSALCRLLSASAWSDPDCAWLELAAAVAAWPLCVLLCAGCRVLTPRRSAHLAADARLAPALAALAASASAPVVAVARLALSRLAAASPDSAAAVSLRWLARRATWQPPCLLT